MGEPLNNYSNVLEAIAAMNNPRPFCRQLGAGCACHPLYKYQQWAPRRTARPIGTAPPTGLGSCAWCSFRLFMPCAVETMAGIYPELLRRSQTQRVEQATIARPRFQNHPKCNDVLFSTYAYPASHAPSVE